MVPLDYDTRLHPEKDRSYWKELWRQATALQDSRGVMYRQRERAPGLELRRVYTRRSVSWIPVVSTASPVASRTKTKRN